MTVICTQCQRRFGLRGASQRLCSRQCASDAMPSPMLDAFLAILRQNAHTWLTLSDLAIWLYGDDALSDRKAVGQLWQRARARGYRLARRAAPWAVRGSLAYRLIEPALEAVA